jgi:FKBP-type peptidyl-prolyl cis-trans isomerase FkpA
MIRVLGIGMGFLALATICAVPSLAARRARSEPNAIALPLKLIIPEPQRLCALKTPSGLGYRALRVSTGVSPTAKSVAEVNYIGYLAATGEVFDQNTNASLPVNAVIPGFSEGLMLMQTGSMYRLCIPAKLGYAGRATGPIPANSDLVFQVELIGIKAE